MKITQVELYEVEIPPIPAIARYYPKIYDITLCRVQTDEGLEGWGEFIDKKSVGQEQADALVGQDPLALDPYNRPDALHLCAARHCRSSLRHSAAPLLWGAGARQGAGVVLVVSHDARRDCGRGRDRGWAGL